MEKMQRFLVRRKTKEVFVWTDALSKGYPELEEVVALSAQIALDTKALPDPRHISLAEIESMKKADLIIFAKMKLGVELDAAKSAKELVADVKIAIFAAPEADAIEEVKVDMRTAKPGQAVDKTTAVASARAARRTAGA